MFFVLLLAEVAAEECGVAPLASEVAVVQVIWAAVAVRHIQGLVWDM